MFKMPGRKSIIAFDSSNGVWKIVSHCVIFVMLFWNRTLVSALFYRPAVFYIFGWTRNIILFYYQFAVVSTMSSKDVENSMDWGQRTEKVSVDEVYSSINCEKVKHSLPWHICVCYHRHLAAVLLLYISTWFSLTFSVKARKINVLRILKENPVLFCSLKMRPYLWNWFNWHIQAG